MKQNDKIILCYIMYTKSFCLMTSGVHIIQWLNDMLYPLV